jgi:transposase
MLLANLLLPDESQLCIDRVETEGEDVLLSVSSTRATSLCPLCNRPSDRVHSQYQRHPADLPIVGHAVRLDMNVRKFFCDNNDCKRVIFTERLPSVLASYARRTNRLASRQQRVAFALGGEAGANLSTIMDMTTSPDTLLRLIHNTPEREVKTPRVLGVDDWAKRKGQSYGTILVDLEAHQPVDLLPDRSAESFAKWLKEHPGVEIISRDRGKEYIKGATDGAPDAIQVADRWHLLKNLRDALKQLLEGKRACLTAAAEESKAESKEGPRQNESTQEKTSPTHIEQIQKVIAPKSSTEEPADTPKLTKAEKQKLERRVKRQERYEAVKELHEHGVSKSAIARRLRLDWRTVSKYVKAGAAVNARYIRNVPDQISLPHTWVI